MRRIGSDAGIAAMLGSFAMWVSVGLRIVDPSNTAWLRYGDPAANFVAWEYFRQSPWTMPLGVIVGYGPEHNSSIVYSDSIPLLAIPLKALNGMLPAQFQYFGLWVLMCFVLQVWFSLKLASVISSDFATRIAVSCCFAFAPILGWRLLPTISHFALAGQFLIVAALWLAIDRSTSFRWKAWTALLLVAVLVHAYLFVMVGVVWLADLLDRRLHGERIALVRMLVPVYVVGAAAWASGYFVVAGDAGAWGYGMYRASPIALVDAGDRFASWSHLLPPVPDAPGNHEGFGYLGSGIIVLLMFALVGFRRWYRLGMQFGRRHPWLLGMSAISAMFALTNQIGTDSVWYSFDLPDAAFTFASIFRASGRFVWLPVLLITFGTIAAVVSGFPRKRAAMLLLAAVTLQVVDGSQAIAVQRDYGERTALSRRVTPLHGPFWDVAGQQYDEVHRFDPVQYSVGWQRISLWALEHQMRSNVVYVSRISGAAWDRAMRRQQRQLHTGNYDLRSLYVIDDARVADVATTLRSPDALLRIDGFNVLAPGWNVCARCRSVPGLNRL